MKKSFEINLGGRIFNIDEDAFELLNSYIESLKKGFAKNDDGDEIISDIENRLGELCEGRMREGSARIVDYAMVDEFITRMGRPENFDDGTADEISSSDDKPQSADEPKGNKREPWSDAMLLGRKFFRNTRDALLGGVCSGLATYIGWDVWLIRAIFIVLFFYPLGMLAPIGYLIAWAVMPAAVTVTDYMRMRDVKPVAGESIEEAWKREYRQVTIEMENSTPIDDRGRFKISLIVVLIVVVLPLLIALLFFAGYFTVLGSLLFKLIPFV